MKSFVIAAAGFAAVLFAGMAGAGATDTQLPLPDVHVTAPGPTNTPPYLRDTSRAASNPYHGRFRVEEDRFVPVPCAQTRVSSSAGGTCLMGYKLTPGIATCDMSLAVVSRPRVNRKLDSAQPLVTSIASKT